MPRRDEPHPVGQAVARRITKLRTEHGLTIDRLGWQSGVAKGHLSNVERGLALPNVATLDKLARGLGVERFYFLVFPEKSIRDRCAERLRTLEESELRDILERYPKKKVRRPPEGRRRPVPTPRRS